MATRFTIISGVCALLLGLGLGSACSPSAVGGLAPPGDFSGGDGDGSNGSHNGGNGGPGGDGDHTGSGGDGDHTGSGGCDLQAVMARPENGCTNAGCHGANYQGGLDLASPGLAQRLMGAVSQTQACGGQPIVDTSEPDNSLLLRMIDPARFQKAPCGVMMPLGSSKGVSADTLACFESFVSSLSGSGGDGDGDAPAFEPAEPVSYVNKVKTLLTGHAATPDDIAKGQTADGLKSLVSTWVEAPELTDKLTDFFTVALQQRLNNTAFPVQFQSLRGARTPQFRANVEQSFVRTALAIVAEGRPFTDILTTRKWAVTTAMLTALAYDDQTDNIIKNNKHNVVAGAGTDSVETRTWHVPGITCAPRTPIPTSQMLDLMLGFANCAGSGAYKFSDGTLLTDADFNDWRMVDIVKATDVAQVPLFYDVANLRSLNQVSLMQARVGFFSTPAFLENWETNEDNQFRVTTSQTLIVALGEIFSPADPTQPVRLDGLAKDHATPGSTCYGCHQFLDPMREYFARNYSFNYHRGNTAGNITPSFAFQGVTHDGGAIGDFASTLASHPEFALGWVQKLCYWANSQACDRNDAEFKRVAAAWVQSGYKFKTLLIELMSSPLVTYAAPSGNVESFVSITRKQHLCQLLDARLGTTNACDQAKAFATLIPEDDFSRGSAEPVQTAVTGLFHYAAAEKLCTRLATVMVGNAEGSRFKVSDPEGALDSFVADLMGFGAGDARAANARAQLASHFQRASAQTNAQAGLRSAFVLACMAPEVMAVGL